MSKKVVFLLDGEIVEAEAGTTILNAAEAAGKYIPRLCAHKDLTPHGSCRVCTVLVNGRAQTACTQPIADGIMVDSSSEQVKKLRSDIIEMLFVEGNHFCMFCEKSGNCELQALAYRFGITAPKYQYLFPKRDLDASHPDIFMDRNRCILCGRCVRASSEVDGKNVFQFINRGSEKRVAVNSSAGLGGTDAEVVDRAVDICPVGAIVKKRTGFRVPVGSRLFDKTPIGSEVERSSKPK